MQLLLVLPDNKYGNCNRNSNYSEKCKVKKVRRDQLNHERLPARYRNTIVRELYRRVGGASRPLINPLLAQFESVFFGLFLGLERSSGGFESFNFYCLIQVPIKNQSP
jgi:hypothetical protein